MPEYGHHSPSSGAQPAASSLTYAIGDIHGSLSKLQRLMERCARHAQGRPTRFVFLGDYIDRGPDSAGVVRYVIELQSQRREHVIALKGNHEAVALDVIDGTAPEDYWLALGGAATLRSYGVDRAQALPREHVDWLRSLRLSYDDGRRFFVHAGIDPEKPLAAQRDHDMLWIRDPFLLAQRDYGRLVVHGHTPLATGKPDLRGNRLNLDTAAVFGGPLTAAVFTDAQTRPIAFLQAN
ncbi:MAG TPA: metallophosphoesterase family protein [Xanthobacteraceae bacterium]|nr:metallophosphoesterase family protein [Xanthobacteraceae bacterium]